MQRNVAIIENKQIKHNRNRYNLFCELGKTKGTLSWERDNDN